MGPFDLVKNARSCDVNFKEEEKLSEKRVVRVSDYGMLGFCLFVWLLFNLLIKKYISPFSLLFIFLLPLCSLVQVS